MISALIGKFAPLLLVLCLGGVGGMFLQHKVFSDPVVVPECPSCPDCNCPNPTVSVQPFEVDKIKGLKEFIYSPQYTGNIAVNGVDSSSVHKWITQSVMRAFEKHVVTTDKKRRR
jgi:hypothetical protein